MTNTLHFSGWRNCIRAQRKVNLCAPGAPKGPEGRMVVRQYEILCANDAGRAPRKYPALLRRVVCINSIPTPNYYNIESKSNVTYLGVTLDQFLSGEIIASNILYKSSNKLKFLYRNAGKFNLETKNC